MFFGEDFRKGLRTWLYPQEPMQGLWRGIGLAVGLFLVFEVIMVPLIGACIARFGFGVELSELRGPDGLSQQFIQGFMISMFPSMLLLCLLSWGVVQRGLPGNKGTLPLNWPKLGIIGWLLIIVGFFVLVLLLITVLFAVTKVDSTTTKGLIEKSMQELAGNKLRFALTVPGVVLGAPVAEELLFRGYLFAALAPSRVGKFGAVIITAALWAVAHAGPAPWPIVGAIFMMGLVLGFVLLRFGSLWVTIVLHAMWNAIQTWGLFTVGSQ